jgi:hypothetical protein
MERLRDAVAAIPEKYVADFTVLLQEAFCQQQPDPRWRMVIAMPILRDRVLFSVSKNTIQQYWKQFKKELFPSGRRSVLSEEILAQIFHDISVEFEHGRPLYYDMVVHWLDTEHHLSVPPDRLRHVIRRTDAFEKVLGIPVAADAKSQSE